MAACTRVVHTRLYSTQRAFSKTFIPCSCLSTSRRLQKELYWNDRAVENEEKFDKILIANRGEIACRVIKTCQRLGIKTVAVHSDVDSLAVHTQLADEAVCIGKAPASESYLLMDNILKAVKDSGAQAVHPGYGFLSENTKFAAKLKDVGVQFIGPNSDSIQMMGDKIESKRIAKNAMVNMIPGYDGVVDDVEHCIKLATEIGFPVMIKASAGGGGKGMRVAYDEDEAMLAFRLCKEEAKSSFGDDRMLVEKFIDNPRHIEIQVLCDRYDNALWLNERECSIQRRNQKVIEEAPSVFLDPGLRKAMGDQAVALARAVGYDSAGTVEFLVDAQKNFYFLEMNTRLQVEHPITECITGIDIVHQMLRVAKGHRLLHRQDDIPVDGWSLECRVYAEDPFKNFGMPSVGRLSKYIEPSHIRNVRCDSGVQEGSEISIYYDPMICKLVTYGPDRQFAIDTMINALDSYLIKGVTHNLPLLRAIMSEPCFVAGKISTNYLTKVFPDGFTGRQMSEIDMDHLVVLSCVIHEMEELMATDFINQDRLKVTTDPRTFWRMNVEVCGATFPASVFKDGKIYEVNIGRNKYTATGDNLFSSPLMDFYVNGEHRILQFLVRVLDDYAASMLKFMPEKKEVDLSAVIVAPMPGMLKSVSVAMGDQVVEGQEVCILEAMKMQNSLVTGKVAKVKRVNYKTGDTVNEGDVIVEFE